MWKSWGRAIALFAVAFVCWYVEIVFVPPGIWASFLWLAAVTASILCLCFLVIAVIRQFKPEISGYQIFAWTDALLGISVAAYAVYDILTDTGWFAGILGYVLLIFVVPVIVLLLVIDFVLYKRRKNKQCRARLAGSHPHDRAVFLEIMQKMNGEDIDAVFSRIMPADCGKVPQIRVCNGK